MIGAGSGARVLTVANQKGGVGKTTTALSLGSSLAGMGRRVLVLDLDPHACASVHLKFYPEDQERSVVDLFRAGAGDELETVWNGLAKPSGGAGFDFVPGSVRTSEIEQDLKERQGKGGVLKQALAGVRRDYDYILLDCPPQVGIVLINALVAADLLIIPIQTEFLALHGLKLLFDTLRTLNRALEKPVKYRALATLFDRRANACQRVLKLLRGKLGDRLFETVIHEDTKFREASAKGGVITELYPESRGAEEYGKLAREIEGI